MTLVSIKLPDSRSSRIGDWQAAIRALAHHDIKPGTTRFNPDAAIARLESEIASGHPDFDDCPIIKTFKSKVIVVDKTPTTLLPVCNATVHCEAGLGVLICNKDAQKNPVLPVSETIKVRI